VKSLDPRVNRLPKIQAEIVPKIPLDQLGTFEVFVQPKENRRFQHEGIVHASDPEMAFVLAKEAFTRRFLCFSMYIVDTRHIFVSSLTEDDQNAYDTITESFEKGLTPTQFEIYHLFKRGKQHQHAGHVNAGSHHEAMFKARQELKGDKQVFNIWAIKTSDIRFTKPEELDFWNTLPEKKFRDASDYKGGDKLKNFLDQSR
jgi:ring-1,2-phenylacetyl-CoA epoxidase subunit PaaB